MRKLLMLLTCLCISLTYSTAQEKTVQAKSANLTYNSPASKAASLDPSVEEYINPTTNQAFYLRKNVCNVTGKVSFDTLEYCSKSSKFVNVTPVKEVRSSCMRTKGVYSTQVVKAPQVNSRSDIEYLKAQKAACSSAKTKVKLVKSQGNKR